MAIPPLVLRIVADSSGVKKGVAETQAQVSGLRGTISKNAGLIQGALAGAVVAGVAVAIDAASSLAESINKTGVVFGASAAEIQTWSEDSAEAFGLSQQAALEYAGTFGQVIQVSGLTEQAAASMSTELVELASDLASFNNIGTDEALEKIRAGLVGEAEPLRTVGVLLSETRVQQEAYTSGLAKAGDVLTDAQKVQARYNIIMKDTAKQQGDFARTSEGFANQQRILSAKVTDAAASLGKVMLPAVTDTVEILGDAVDLALAFGDALGFVAEKAGLLGDKAEGDTNPALEALKTIFTKSLPSVLVGAKNSFFDLTDALGITHDELTVGTSLISDYGGAVDRVAGAFPVLQGLLKETTDAQLDQNAAVADSISVTREAAGGLLGLIEASRTLTEAQRTVNRLEENGKKGTKEYHDAVTDLLTQRLELSAALDDLAVKWEENGTSLRDAKIALEQVGRQAGLEGAALRRFIRRGLEPLRGELEDLKAGSPYNFTVQATANFTQLENKLRGLEARYDLGLPVAPEHKAAGGPVALGRPYVVGEKGPELFVPASAGTVVPNGGSSSRTRREAAYLDRVRWERDHAYSREYEGWR